MASAEKIVDLFNASTWCGVDYNPLVNLVHRRIALHPIHHQRVENHVQMAALVATTHVEEDWRTWRAMSLSIIMRPFNENTVDDKKQKVVDQKKREKIIRIEGQERVEQFVDHCDDFDAKVCKEMEKLGTKKFNYLCERITGDAHHR